MSPGRRSAAIALCLLPAVVRAQQHEHLHPEAVPAAPAVQGSTQSEREHVAPDPPSHAMPDMSYREMVHVMDMDDRRPYHRVLLDRLERRRAAGHDELGWDGEAYWGNDYDKAWMKSEGAASRGDTREARIEVAWDHIVSRWWSAQAGLRHDWGGPSRDWLALGVQGLAPYFFEVEATAYVGDAGRTALRLRADHDLLLTQRWILQSGSEINVYGKDDPATGRMSGVSDLRIGLRLRYEIRRELAPYVGVSWQRALGGTATLHRARGEDAGQFTALAGLRLDF